MNEEVYKYFLNVMMIVEELMVFFGVFVLIFMGGFGFGFKWNMGWMYDSLLYIKEDLVYCKYYYNILIFLLIYVFSENYVFFLLYDEVVYGKCLFMYKMLGDEWQ